MQSVRTPKQHAGARSRTGRPSAGPVQAAVIAVGWTLLLSSTGCVHPLIMTKMDYDYYNAVSTSYGRAEYDSSIGRLQTTEPRTADSPDRERHWRLTLEEAKRIALENNKQILTIANQPGQAAAAIDQQLSQFDAYYSFGGGWGRENQPLTSNIATAGTGQDAVTIESFGQGGAGFFATDVGGFGVNATTGGPTQAPLQFVPLDRAIDIPDPSNLAGGSAVSLDALSPRSRLSSNNPDAQVDPNRQLLVATNVFQSIPGANVFEVFKRNATGGTTRLNYTINYRNQQPIGGFTLINPVWTQTAQASFQQPLLQGAGVEFNRAPILIARANFEQSVRSFESFVHSLLRDVELAYWQMYSAYSDMYAQQDGLERALRTWRRAREELDQGRSSRSAVAQAREQFELFRSAYIQSLQRVMDAERVLRLQLGLPADDDRRIIPADEPTAARYAPDWSTAVLEAMSLRPDLTAQAYAVRAAELQLFRQQNGLLPDATVNGSWALTGLDNQFDQAFDRMTDAKYESWSLGGRVRGGIGERAANAAVRGAQLTLSRERDSYRNLQHNILHELAEAYRNLIASHQLLLTQEDRFEAAAAYVKIAEDLVATGRQTISDDRYLRAQAAYSDSLRARGQAVAQYNQSLIRWEFAKGTILSLDNVVIAESSVMRANRKLLEERRRIWECSLPLPIWPGEAVQGDFFPCPSPDAPLYATPPRASTSERVEEVPAETESTPTSDVPRSSTELESPQRSP